MLIAAASTPSDSGLLLRARLTGFSGFLRANGFGVGGGDSARALDAACRVGVLDPHVLRWSLKALLCGRGDEWRRFDALFDAYFLPPNRKAFAVRTCSEGAVGTLPEIGDFDRAPPSDPSNDAPGAVDAGGAQRASREESLGSQDFSELDRADDARAIEALMRRFARRLKSIARRREARSRHGRRLDLQATIRKSVESGGTPFRLAWKDRRRTRPRLVLLLDVSRSMSLYSFFYLRLARALCAELADVHCYIFHTRLTGVSEALRDADPWRSQERLHLLAGGWAGGTRIGECLRDFDRGHAHRLVHARTAIIVVSDGFDTGEPAMLVDALVALRRRARRIVWLNPLLRKPGFTVEARAMRAALPYLDLFAAGADLASIEGVLPQLLDTLR